MANPDSNLPAALQTDFLSVPTDAELQNLELPDNSFLPYADEVTEEWLFSVTTRTIKANPLTGEVPDTFGFNGDGRDQRDFIYQAYERVTGHDDLDPQQPLNRAGEGAGGDDNDFTYNTYGNALHNGLMKYRESDLLSGASIYHLTRRLITYLQDQEPDQYLGSLAGGRWWLAPDCYHILVYDGRIQNGPGPAPAAYGATLSANQLSTDNLALALYGADRALDSARFDAALFTFHWINIQFYTYKDPKKTAETDADKDDHWALVIRHAGTNVGYYFDSLFSGEGAAEQARRLQLVQTAINRWLQDSNKSLIVRLEAPAGPVQRIISGKNLWQCGVHTLANVIAFIRCGRLGWHRVPTWRAVGAPGTARLERHVVDEIRNSLHWLMGLSHDVNEDTTRRFDKAEMSKWKKPASKSGKADLAKTAAAKKQQEAAAKAKKKKDKEERKKKEADTQTQRDAEARQMRADIDAMRADITALVALVRADIDSRGGAVTNRENALKRKRHVSVEDEDEEVEEVENGKRQKTPVPFITLPSGLVVHTPTVKRRGAVPITPTNSSPSVPATPATSTTTTTTTATTTATTPTYPSLSPPLPAPVKDPN